MSSAYSTSERQKDVNNKRTSPITLVNNTSKDIPVQLVLGISYDWNKDKTLEEKENYRNNKYSSQ